MLAERGLFFDDFVWIASRAETHELLRAVKLTTEHGQHIHPRMWLTLQEHRDIVAVYFDADSRFERRRVGLMRVLNEHRSEAQTLARSRHIAHHLLLISFYNLHPHA